MTNVYFNLNQIQSNPDCEPTVSRQSRLMSLSGKKAEKEQLSRDCLSLASELPLTCPRPDTVSLACRCRVLDTHRYISVGLSARVWKHVAMIFAVLVMSMANVGMAWGATYETKPYFSVIPKANTCSLSITNDTKNQVLYCDASSAATLSSASDGVTFCVYNNSTGSNKYFAYDANGGWKIDPNYGWVTFYSDTAFVAGDSIVIYNDNKATYACDLVAASSSTTNCSFSNVASSGTVATPSSTTPAKKSYYYFILPNTFVTSNYIAVRRYNASNAPYFSKMYAYHKSAPASSDSYDIHIGKNNADYTDESLTNTSGTTWSKTITLDAGSYYEFKVKKTPSAGDAVWYGNNGAIVTDIDWNFPTSGGNAKLYTGPAGDYVFTFNTSTGNVTITYPDVEHPCANYVYFVKPNDWNAVRIYNYTSDSYRMSDWDGSPTTTKTATICGNTYYYCAASTKFDNVIWRDNNSHQSTDLGTSGGLGKYFDFSVSTSAWQSFTSYTISFANGGGTGTMSAITGICPNSNQAITANAFEKTGYTFNCWHADKAVKVGGSTIPAGDDIAGGATLQEINNDITLTAQWTCVTPTFGTNLSTSQVDYDKDASASALTVAATAGGGTVTYQWYSNDENNTTTPTILTGQTSTSYTPSTATTGTTYYYCVATNSTAGCSTTTTSNIAKIVVSAATYTVTYNVNGGGSVDPTSATQASAGASLTLPTPTWSGYTFEGWYNAGTKVGNAGASYTPTANITLYAHWTDNISGKVFSFIDNNYGDKFKAFDESGWVTSNQTGKSKTYTNGTTGVQYIVSAGCWDSKSNAISALAKFKGGTSSMSVVIPTGKIATVKISYNAYGTGDAYRLTVNGSAQSNPSTKLADDNTNAQVISNMKEITLSNQTGTLTLGISDASKNNYIGRVSAVITGYTISYAAGTYGSGSLASGTKTHGSNFTLSDNSSAFSRDGFTYDGWSINADGTTKDYDLGGTYSTDAVITLYPHWVAAACTAVAAPTALTCSAQTSSSLTFTWTKASNASTYTAKLYSDSGCESQVASQDLGDVNTVTFNTLTANTTYYCKVQSHGDGSTYCADGGTTSAQSGTTDADTPVGTTYYLVTSTAQLNTTDTYVIMDDGKAAMMGVATDNNPYLNAITSGFTVAVDKSTVTVTSSDVNTLTLKSESDAWNLFGKDSHYITTNSTVNGNLYGNATSGSGTDNFVFLFADGKVTIKRNTTTDYHIYYSSGTGFNQSTTATNIRLYTSNSTPVYTVTYDLNGGTGTVPTHRAEKSGTSITLASSTGLTKSGYTFDGWLCNVNSTKYAAGASYTMTAANTTFTAQWEAVSGYTVTYKYNGATSGASPESATGTSVTLPTPTRTGYELDGWYTTAGEKVGNGDETYGPEADITLYARWQEACDAEGVAKSTTDVAASGYTAYQEKGGSNVVFTSAPSLGFKYKDADGNTINNSTTAVVRNNAYKCQISSDSGNKGSIKTNSTFSNVDSISFYFAASDKGGCKIAVWCSTDDFSADSTQLLSATTYADNNNEFKLKTLAIPSGKKASALTFKFRFTVTSSGKTSYIDSLKVYSSTSGGGTCYHVYYHGNGAESGYVNDTVSYTAGSKATVLNYNYGRNPLAKTGYDFRGWATSASGAVAYSAGQKIDITSADVDLYAVWAPASLALVNWTMGTNTSTWSATATSTTDGTNITSIGTARTNGSDGKREGATAKVTMAEKEVSSTAAPSNSANFTFTIAGGKQVEINKFDCKVFNVSDGSRTYKAQISDAAGNVYNSTNTVPVTASATLTDASFVFGSGKILRGAVTIRIYAWKTSGSPTEFRMGPDVKFYGTVQDYTCATPAAPTISGVSEYVPGQTITLTASHDGENYDNLTTYTWYKGADWATASSTTPVQAAATGESGYTLTIDDCTTGNAGLYWCEAANGTCTAHSATGYEVTVFPAYTITYHLDGGNLDGSEKTSYTQFDEDYTLPTPTKTGSVFAGWYGASDFSGLPTVVLGAGSVGDKEYYAKWGAVVTVSWTVTKVDDELYRGGGGYSVKAVINETDWSTGFMDELELTATEGVTLKNIEVSENGESKVQVTADFDITTDLAADATSITFTLNVPADGKYGPKVDEHEEELTSCAGSSTVWNFAYASDDRPTLTNSNASTEGNKNTLSATTGSGNLYYFAGSSDAFETDKYLKMNGASSGGSVNSRSVYQNRCFYIDITSNGTLTIQQYADNGNGAPKYVVANTRPLQSDYPSSSVAPTTTGGATYEINVTNYSSGTADRIWVAYPTAKAYIISVTWTPTGGGGTVTPTLTWETDLSSTVEKVTGDADFTHYVTQNKNSLGTITYSSSDETVATVNATTGKVHIVGAEGTATITATLAASGCFNGATATYTISVVDNCIDVPGTIEWTDLGCDGIRMTVSGHTAEAGVTYQWYRVGSPDEEVSDATSDTYTATAAGEYYVMVTNTGTDHCAMASSNTVTVEAKAAATVTKIVDSWYVKKDRRTPDVELVKTTGATGFTVKIGSTVIWNSDGSNITGFAGCGFHMGENGIIYLNGTKDNGDAPAHDDGTWAAGDETLTITAIGCGSSASQNITIHKQAATTYKEIAFVADGGKGMRKDSITVGHGDGTELYEYLDSVKAAGNRLFKLSERNIYWTTDEKAIREEYSQFDGILITDDPSTNTVVKDKDDYKTKGYVNAFGTMVDVRPIFTMEAYVSALTNWGSKGIKGSPESPNPRQYEMRLECKDHEIYGAGLPTPEDGTNVWEEVVDGETFRHVILVDSTLGIYKGVKYNQETAGNKKPALQGFTGEAAGSLLGLGRILEGTLQAAIERQEEPAARLLVMGINAKALQPTCALTDEGKTVIKNILVYLLKTNMEEVDDCSNYFTGKYDNDWSKAGNWSKSALPSSEAKVRILAPCVISGSRPHVAQVAIVSSGKSSIRETATGSANCDGKLTINADGALIVGGKIRTAVAPHFAANDLKPTTVNNLTINTNGSGQAALIFNNDAGDTKATVNLYSLGRKEGAYQFQYFAVPMEYVDVNPAFYGSNILTYVWHENGGWERRGYYTGLSAFEGVGITKKDAGAKTYTMQGNLTSTAEKDIALTHESSGQNIVGNSWLAPINIASLRTALEDDANIVDKTVYIYCTGNDKADGDDDVDNSSTETAGQWLAIPINAAGWDAWTGLKVIPAMQAFCIKANTETTLTLNYKDHVRSTADAQLNEKLRAPKRRTEAESEGIDLIRIRVADSKTHTDLYLFEGEPFSEEFDNGWEAEYMSCDGRSAKLYAETTIGQMAVVAQPEYEGTVLGFAPGKETEYTFTFSGPNKDYYLNDLKLKKSTLISEDESYFFTFEEGDTNRFYISKTRIDAPAITTGTEKTGDGVKARKVIVNDKLYIILNGKVYSAEGMMVK